jgi:hypothetical protein
VFQSVGMLHTRSHRNSDQTGAAVCCALQTMCSRRSAVSQSCYGGMILATIEQASCGPQQACKASNPIHLCLSKLMKTRAVGHQLSQMCARHVVEGKNGPKPYTPDLQSITWLCLRLCHQLLWALALSWCSLMLDSTSRAGTGAKKPEMNRPAGTQPDVKTPV